MAHTYVRVHIESHLWNMDGKQQGYRSASSSQRVYGAIRTPRQCTTKVIDTKCHFKSTGARQASMVRYGTSAEGELEVTDSAFT
jgi:hypothetical protein